MVIVHNQLIFIRSEEFLSRVASTFPLVVFFAMHVRNTALVSRTPHSDSMRKV